MTRPKDDPHTEEQIKEYESKEGVTIHYAKKGRYGGSEKPIDPLISVRGPTRKDLEKIETQKKSKKKKFSEIVEIYRESGIKGLFEELKIIEEEASEKEFDEELKKQKEKASGINTEDTTVEERTLSEPEIKKREEIVKSMKKNLAGFKERYGERAKEVMYATATKLAKEE